MEAAMKQHLLAMTAFALFVAGAQAQDPYTDPNISPAYRHFLTSPYSFRTYSHIGSGRSWGYDSPFESSRFYQTPGYYHEEISPHGRWSYEVPSRVEGYVRPRPVVVYPPVFIPAYSPWP
jgi:hypothetical protein